jgi:Flp pilus assembly protein TadD
LAAGKDVEASRFASDWLSEQSADADFLMHLGSAAMTRRDYGAAEMRYREVLTLRSRDPVALNNVAWTMLQQGKPGALAYAERATAAAPNEPALLDTLATALLAEGQTARALQVQRSAATRTQNAPQIELTLARILIESGERAEARTILNRLSQLGARFSRQDEVAKLLARAQ